MSAQHPRRIIREKVASLLALGATAAGSRVWPSRGRPWLASKVPAIGVYTVEEESPTSDTSPRSYARTVTVLVELHLDAMDDRLDDAMDDLAKQVEDILLADPTWGGVADDSALMSTTMGFDAKGEKERGMVLMVWEADYTTRPQEADPATLDDFVTAHVDWDLRPHDPDADADATDTVTLPQED